MTSFEPKETEEYMWSAISIWGVIPPPGDTEVFL